MKLRISNLPEGFRRDELRDVLSLYGDVERVFVCAAYAGYLAMVDMTAPEAAIKAKDALDGKIYCKARLKVTVFP